MKNILNITNGDCAVEIMQKANIPGVFLPWRDVLHDGPVPKGLSLERLSEIRANFIIEKNWGPAEAIKQDFIERDNVLKSFEDYDKIILWFEHDLYDQLQILQLLDFFNQNRPESSNLSMICIDQYLGTLSPEEMAALYTHKKPVTDKQLELSSIAWSAFRSKTPEPWEALLKIDTTALPFLKGAILRLLEEFPCIYTGLSRTAHQALKIISQGEQRPGRVFGASQNSEDRRFMGDSSFWEILHELLRSSPPLLILPVGKELTLPTSPDQELTITPHGEEVLSGKRNWLDNTQINRWIGGVHLTPNNIWYWDSAAKKITRHV